MADTQHRQFVFLVLGLSIPFYVLGAVTSQGENVVALPVSALAVVVPLSAAIIITRRARGSVRRLLASGVRPASTHKFLWMVVGVGIMPVLVMASHLLVYSPSPVTSDITLPAAGALLLMFLLGAYGEELGWTAFAARRLLKRHSVLATGLLVGALWGVWHVVPFVQTNNSWSWIGWQLAFLVAFRVLITAVYAASAQTALLAVLLHGSYNMAWTLLPIYWSSYDPSVLAPLTAVAAVMVLMARRRSLQAAESSNARSLTGAA
jgi:membrane protease YdiL (CAAX protease family)